MLADKYRIKGVIGEGSFGRVYRAEEVALGREVAIKELLKGEGELGSSDYAQFSERFRREARVQAQFNHPNIVHVYDLLEPEPGTMYLVMEYVDGPSLRDHLAHNGLLPVDEAVGISSDILQGLAAVHSHAWAIVHRDVKPSNILLTAQGEPKLADFGLAQVLDDSMRSGSGKPHPGTQAYMSPEQAETTAYLYPPSDLFSVGCILFEMLTGVAYRQAQHSGKSLRDLRPEVPAWVEKVVEKSLAEDSLQRYQTAEEFYAALHAITKAAPHQAGRPAWLTPVALGGGALALLALILLIIGFGLTRVLTSPRPAPASIAANVPSETTIPGGAIRTPAATALLLTSTPMPSTATPLPPTAALAPPTPTPITYVVQSGDTLGGIAIQFGVSVVDLQAANGIDDPAKLRVDQELVIPGDDFAPAAVGAVTATPTAGADLTPVPTSTPMPPSLTSLPSPISVPASPTPLQVTPPPTLTHMPVPSTSTPTSTLVLPTTTHTPTHTPVPASTPELIVATSSSDGWIAFTSDHDDNNEIYVMNTDGTGVTRLTNSPAYEDHAAWSPDGQHIAFVSDRDGNIEIYMMNADGSGATRLTKDPAHEHHPTWSPDGQHIAFVSDRDGNDEIYMMNADGSGVTRLTNDSARDTLPTWSPDGHRVAFSSVDDYYNYEITAINVDDSSRQTILARRGILVWAPDWSPDGMRIAFVGDLDMGKRDIYIVNVDGSGLSRVTHGSHAVYPTWSPDGTRIAFFAAAVGGIHVTDTNGTNVTRLIERGWSPAWSR